MRRLSLPVALVALLLFAGAVSANTSHAGWPRYEVLKMHKRDQSGPIRGHAAKHNELRGGHGNDRIYGGRKGDVIWGDYKPGGQPTSQVDHLYGRGGRDFIYASHGLNYIWTGSGRDVVHAHFGHGEIHCSRGDTVFLSHRSRPHYRLFHCHRVSYRTLGY
jgi:RTX calcium-binding nonapeptide repeat (4 copies)